MNIISLRAPLFIFALFILCGSIKPLPALAANGAPLMVSVEAANSASDSDRIVLTYSVPVSVEQVHHDISQVSHETGWLVDDVQITRTPDPIHPESGALYSAEITTSNAINRSTGRLPVSQLVMALKDYRELLLVFDVPGPFTYRGNQSYSDHSVDIVMEPQTPGSYTYAFEIRVKDPTFSGVHAPEVNAQRAGASLSPFRIFGALIGALLVGCASYVLILKWTTKVEASVE